MSAMIEILIVVLLSVVGLGRQHIQCCRTPCYKTLSIREMCSSENHLCSSFESEQFSDSRFFRCYFQPLRLSDGLKLRCVFKSRAT